MTQEEEYGCICGRNWKGVDKPLCPNCGSPCSWRRPLQKKIIKDIKPKPKPKPEPITEIITPSSKIKSRTRGRKKGVRK